MKNSNVRSHQSKSGYVLPAVANFYQDSDEEILDRILAGIHSSLDDEFGSETNNDPQFSKTVFKSQSGLHHTVAHLVENVDQDDTAMVTPHTEKFRGTAANIASLSLLSLCSIYFVFEMWRSYFY